VRVPGRRRVWGSRSMVELVTRQNDMYEQELRLQDQQEQRFIGGSGDPENVLADVFQTEDNLVREIETVANELQRMEQTKAAVQQQILVEKAKHTHVESQMYNLRASKQHIEILQHRIETGLMRVTTEMGAIDRAKEKIDHLHRVRALADTGLSRLELEVAKAHAKFEQQREALERARQTNAAAKHQTRLIQEEMLGAKLEFDNKVAEFRKLFLGARDRFNSKFAESGASRQERAKAKSDDPLHVIGEISLEDEIRMTRMLREFEDEAERIMDEHRSVQRSIERSRKLVLQLNDVFSSSSPGNSPYGSDYEDDGDASAAVIFVDEGDVAPATARSRRAPIASVGAIRNVRSPIPFAAMTGEGRDSILNGDEIKEKVIQDKITKQFSRSEARHLALTKQIATKETEVFEAEQLLGRIRREIDAFMPGSDFDILRQQSVLAQRRRGAIEAGRRKELDELKRYDHLIDKAKHHVEGLVEALGCDMRAVFSLQEKLCMAGESVERLLQLEHAMSGPSSSRVASSSPLGFRDSDPLGMRKVLVDPDSSKAARLAKANAAGHGQHPLHRAALERESVKGLMRRSMGRVTIVT
jgi:hypothetical protein